MGPSNPKKDVNSFKRSFNIAGDVLDEIALEGLDGITLTTLFGRLSNRENFNFAIDDHSKLYIWSIVVKLLDVRFYQIPEKRKEIINCQVLTYEDRINLAVLEGDIYAVAPVLEQNEAGSCIHYKNRKDVTEEARTCTLQQACEKWPSTLVMVANLHQRVKSLCGYQVNPDFSDLTTLMDFIYLEMIGRSRERGINSAGPGSLMAISKDSRLIFYHVSHLVSRGVVDKHSAKISSQLRLKRFRHVGLIDSNTEQIQQVVELLKTRPENFIPIAELPRLIPGFNKCSVKRFIETDSAQKFFTPIRLPYHMAYPRPKTAKSSKKDLPNRTVLAIKLIKKEVSSEVETSEDEEDDYDLKDFRMNMPIREQVYRAILAAGPGGIGVKQLQEMLAVHHIPSRMLNQKAFITRSTQCGRQRVTMYVLSPSELQKPAVISLQKHLLNEVSQSVASTPEKGPVLDHLSPSSNQETARKQLRINLILRAVKENKPMPSAQLSQYIHKEEEKLGFKDKMDRRTITRILDHLKAEGDLKVIERQNIILYTSNEEIVITDEAAPEPTASLQDSDPQNYLQAIILESEDAFTKLISEDRKFLKTSQKSPPLANQDSSPKFLRLSALHDLIFYQVRGYTGDTTTPQEELLQQIQTKCPSVDELTSELPRLYADHVSSYMFIPPLSSSHDMVPGWCSFTQIIMNTPLSVYSKLVKSPPVFQEYVDHPIRCHYPVSVLPSKVRSYLLTKRQLDLILTDVRRLCFMGLVRLGNKNLSYSKIRWPLYVNIRGSVLDTTSSAPGYQEVEPNKSYKQLSFTFKSISDVKEYWVSLFNICLETKLGLGRGKEVGKSREFKKDSLLSTLQPLDLDRAEEEDQGLIPGDHLGAGGIDSALFSFRRGSWFAPKVKSDQTVKAMEKPIIKLKTINYKKQKKVRPIRKKKERRKRKSYDETDLEALKQMNRLRCAWTQIEDNVLMLCKAAAEVLIPKKRQTSIKYSDMRAALRRHAGPNCMDKTQSAIHRRINFLQGTRHWAALPGLVQVVRSLPEAQEVIHALSPQEFADLKPTMPNFKQCLAKLNSCYHQLVDFMVGQYLANGVVLAAQEVEIPDSMYELHKIYNLSKECPKKLNLTLIQEDSIRAVVLSSLAMSSDKTSQALQLYEVYRQYDSALLQSVLDRMHRQGILTLRKRDGRKFSFLCAHSPYMFSQRFVFLLNTKYSQSVYHNAYLELNKLLCCDVDTSMPMNLVNCGSASYALSSTGHVRLESTVPEEFIALNTEIISPTTSAKIMKRYEELQQKSDQTYTITLPKLKRKQKEASKEDEPPPKHVKIKEEVLSPSPVEEFMEVDDITSAPSQEDSQFSDQVSSIDVSCAADSQSFMNSIKGKPVTGFRSARIALYVLREIASSEVNSESGSFRKPLDLFIVSAARVSCIPSKALARDYGVSNGYTTKQILQKLVDKADAIGKISDDEQSLHQLTAVCSKSHGKEIKDMACLIESQGVKGVTLAEVRAMPGAREAMRRLEEAGLVLRLGIQDTVLVSRKHASPWAVQSFRLTRTMRENMKPSDSIPKPVVHSSNEATAKPSSSHSSKKVGKENALLILIRPWIRVDGSVNRRVLDRLLGTVLGKIMLNPGLSEATLSAMLEIAFSPVWIKELTTILADIGCISRRIIHFQPPSLFSNPDVHFSDFLDGFEGSHEILIDPKVDAIIKLGQFIGNKSYSKDYLTV